MTTIISIANVAGGVGKTTLAVSLALELSLRGHQTLLVDADPQATATGYFINSEHVRRSLTDVLCLNIYSNSSESSHLPTSLSKVIMPTRFNCLDLVPSTIRLAAFELDFFRKDSSFVLNRLKSQIEQFKTDYDFVIIDTPSSLGQIINACLCASTHVIVPVAPRKTSIDGLRLIVERLGNMRCYSGRANLGDMPCINEIVNLLGVVFNHFDCKRPMFGTLFTEVKREWKDLCFDTVIHRDTLIEACAERLEIVQIEHPRSPAATLYDDLADEVLLRIALPLNISSMRDNLEAR